MKKFLLHFLKFTLFAGVFYAVVLCIWSWIMPDFMAKNVRNCIGCYGHLNTRVKEIPKFKDVDILVLGSSHAYRGFDNRVFEKYGLKLFNLGSSSQSPMQTNVLLNQYVDQLNPKLVVLESYAGVLGLDGVESSLDLAANNQMDHHYYKTLFDLKNIRSINSAIYGTFREILGLNDNFVEDSIQAEDKYVSGGFVETEFRQNPYTAEKENPWEISATQLNYLEKNIELLKEKNIPYLIVQTPITKRLYEARTNNAEIDSILNSYGTYKSFQTDLNLNDTIDFYDSNHLNQEAVVKFNEVFIEYLRKQKLITP
jgi:hypothetical protein